MKYKIADIVLDVEGNETDYISLRMKEYECSREQTADVVVSCKKVDKICYPTELSEVTERIARWRWHFKDNEVTAYDVSNNADFIMSSVTLNSNEKRAVIQACDTCPFSGIKLSEGFFNLLGHAFSFVAPWFDTFVFHSSAISYNNSGILISAPPGTGKSTHAGLWHKYFPNETYILNDDTPAIKKTENGYFVCGTPWSGKTKINANKSVPVKAIVCIRQSKENFIKKLDFKTAFFCVFNEIKKMPGKEHMDKVLELLNELLSQVPVYELNCNISFEAVELLKNTLNL